MMNFPSFAQAVGAAQAEEFSTRLWSLASTRLSARWRLVQRERLLAQRAQSSGPGQELPGQHWEQKRLREPLRERWVFRLRMDFYIRVRL